MALDVSKGDLGFRGYPVTLLSEGVDRLLEDAAGDARGGAWPLLLAMLRDATDTAEPDEPSGWIFQSRLCGQTVWIERFGGMRDLSNDTHEGAQWSVYLPKER
jgi:hypothetical protein